MQKSKFGWGVLLLTLALFACKPFPMIVEEGDEDETNTSMEQLLAGYLVAKYTFDDGTGKDSSANGYDGILINAPTFLSDTPSGTGKAVFLNGFKEQFINIPYSLFSGMHKWSLSFWVKDFGVGSLITGVDPQSHYDTDQTPVFYFENDGHFSENVQYTNRRTSFSYLYTPIQSSNWHHIVWICADDLSSSNSSHRLYVDGVLVDNTSSYFGLNDRVKKVQIGGNADGLYPLFLTAKLDNVTIYNTELSSDAIGYIFNHCL